jgi:CubicO group peptidase (beta-lactamase class C family)
MCAHKNSARSADRDNPWPGSVGEFYWVGGTGTDFWGDPKERLIAVLTAQLAPTLTRHYRSLIRNLVYQALVSEVR